MSRDHSPNTNSKGWLVTLGLRARMPCTSELEVPPLYSRLFSPLNKSLLQIFEEGLWFSSTDNVDHVKSVCESSRVWGKKGRT